MLRVFEVTAGGVTTVSAPVTLVFINPKASPGVGIRILRCYVTWSGAATSAQNRVQLETQVTAFPTLTSATPRPVNLNDSASVITGGAAGAAGTSGINATAEGAGSKTVIKDTAFNTLIGFEWVATINDVIELQAGTASGFGLFLPVTPTPSNTPWSAGVVFQEF